MRRVIVALAIAAATVLASAPLTASAAEPDAPVRAQADGEGGAEGFCGSMPWIAGAVCDGVATVVGGGVGFIVEGGAKAALTAVVGFVVEGAAWLLGEVAGFIDTSTRPDLSTGWFQASYSQMAVIATLGVLPFLILALLQAIVRQDVGMMLRSAFAYVPLAAIGTAGAVVIVDLLVTLTDTLSGWVGQSIGADLASFATGLGTAVTALTVPAGPTVAGFAALIAAGLVAFVTFVIWLELLLRQAAIYVAVLFLPLAFMAMVWPATAHWLRRLMQGLVAIILSKFVIVAVIAMAASAIDAETATEGYGVVITGGALLSLSALAPYVLLRLIPVFDAGLSSQLEGTVRRPTAAAAPPARGNQMVHMIRQRAAGRSSAIAPSGGPTGGQSGGGLPVGMAARAGAGGGAAPAATGAVGAAAAGATAAGRAATRATRRAASTAAATTQEASRGSSE